MKISDFKEFETKEISKLTGGTIYKSCKKNDNFTQLSGDEEDDAFATLHDKYDDTKGDPHLGT